MNTCGAYPGAYPASFNNIHSSFHIYNIGHTLGAYPPAVMGGVFGGPWGIPGGPWWALGGGPLGGLGRNVGGLLAACRARVRAACGEKVTDHVWALQHVIVSIPYLLPPSPASPPLSPTLPRGARRTLTRVRECVFVGAWVVLFCFFRVFLPGAVRPPAGGHCTLP